MLTAGLTSKPVPIGKQFVRELEEFFLDYHKLSGEQYRVLGLKGRAESRKLLKSSRK
jgi:inorganic pyrophosphatase